MKRKILWIVGILFLGIALWYFFLKEYHYQVSFTTSEPAGIVYHHIVDWPAYDKFELEVETISKAPYTTIEQHISKADSVFRYVWHIEKESDGLTKVTARITDSKNNFTQKLGIFSPSNDFVKRSIANVALVGDALVKKAEAYNVHSVKQDELPAKYCAFISLETDVNKKASTMLKNIATVMDYLNDNEIELVGDPFIEVTKWNEAENTMNFNFCFPISENDALPETSEVQFKKTEITKGISAEFNGNYRISQNAWYYLIEYANSNNLTVDHLPTEVFLNDPHAGGNPLEWKALIFLPLKD